MEETGRYLSILNPEQREAVCHTGSPLLILAGAGSGKTRVITTKIAWLIAEKGIPPESILAVTFTNKAAREMSERARALDERSRRSIIRTFHSFGAWILRRYAQWAGLSQNFTIYDDDDSATLLMKAVPALNKQEAQGFMRKISRAKDYCFTPDSSALIEIDPTPEFADIYRTYQQRLKETGNVDFGDLIMLPVKLIEEHAAIARQFHVRFKVILVDEYQDSNIAQFQLLRVLTGDDTYVCVVGDDDQSIYRFRGAEVQNILTFDRQFTHTKVIRLVRNYRSYEPILRVADCIVSHNEGRLGKTLVAERGSGQKPRIYYLPSQDAEAELCVSLIKKAIEMGGFYSDWAILYRTNAQSLNFETTFLHEKIPHKVVGALKFYEREEIKDALSLLALIANGRDEIAFRRMVNKPTRGIGEVTQNKLIAYIRATLADLEEKDGLQASQRIAQAQNTSVKDSAASEQPNGSQRRQQDDYLTILLHNQAYLPISKKAGAALQDFVRPLYSLRLLLARADGNVDNGTTGTTDRTDLLQGEQLAAFVLTVIEQTGLGEFHRKQDEIMSTQKTANLQELANAAALYPCTLEGLTDFLEHIELDRSLAETDESGDAVQLITIHNTKGLEFRNVIITGLENGIFPRNDADNEEIEEERRLLYVACTRAQNALYITCCAARRMYGKLSFMEPSLFLTEIDDDLVESVGEPLAGLGSPAFEETALWKCGQRIFHDDYGYGYIVQSHRRGGELVITVQFENGGQKCFFPAYQKQQLMRVDE